MNLSIYRLLFLSFLTVSLSNMSLSATGNVFFATAQDQVDKISNKTQALHKPPLEFKQAVTRYIKHTDVHCLQNFQRGGDETVSYKKELRYLFKNYGKFATGTLLSRVRSAHQEMVKAESDAESDVYKRYEQISSALLLTCAQVFFNDARNQILNALDEIDTLIVYWRYQQHHQLSYFFSKSPTKWILGKAQAKEIANNISKLVRKQRELYTLLGLLTGHVHTFTESGVVYDDCYAWIDELFEILSCVQVTPNYNSDGTKCDDLAAELCLKIKRVGLLKSDSLSSIASARKPNHFVRHWIPYTTMLAAAGYAAHYNNYHPEVIPGAIAAVHVESLKFFNLLVDPFKKIYKRAEIAFSPAVVEDKQKSVVNVANDDNLEPLFDEMLQVAGEVESNISDELKASNTVARERLFSKLEEAITEIKNPQDGYMRNTKYIFDEEKFNNIIAQVRVRVSPIVKGGEVINKKEVEAYQNTLVDLRKILVDLSGQTSFLTASGQSLCGKLNVFDILFEVVDDFAEPLKRYTDIIDDKVLKLVRLIVVMAVNLGRRGDALAKEADAKLQDNELTFMFTALIPLITTGVVATKAYQWITQKNYSPIRIALADVNALLIESETRLDDHDYGKLVYLICKLRHRASSLKDSLSHEFLVDVAKLESKQYTPHIKCGIVENMFNKYAFLGRIAA